MSPVNEVDRRRLLQLIAAGAAATLTGCGKPDEEIYPAVDPRDGSAPGVTRRYATALELSGYGRGVTGLVVDNRPIKLEGLAAHPASLGATDLFAEVSILDLYDPQRLRAPMGPSGVSSWSLLQRALLARLAGSDGSDLRLLTGRITSPTMLVRIDEMRRRFPAMRRHRFEAVDDDAARAGAALAFGRPLAMRPRFAEADAIVAFDDDPLGPGPDQIAFSRGWADRRRAPGPASRLTVLEPSLTLTGSCADRRVALAPQLVTAALLALANALDVGTSAPPLPAPAARAIAAAARDLASARGRGVVLVGRGQPPEAHALAAFLNQRLAAPIDWIEPVDPDPAGHTASLAELARDMHRGRVGTLVMLDVNPVQQAPAALGFRQALGRVPFSLAASSFPTETSDAAQWAAPLSHALERWGDVRAPDGLASIVQPLIRPLYRTRSALELLDLVDPPSVPTPAYDRVRDRWRAMGGDGFDRWWRDVLVAGIVPESRATPVAPSSARLVLPRFTSPPALQLTLTPSSSLWDGRFASNAWAQECPDPHTKEVWGASLRLSAADARCLELADGDEVALGRQTVAIHIVSGQAEGVATLPLGYGRSRAGPIAGEAGANGFALRPREGGWAMPVSFKATGRSDPTPSTAHHFDIDVAVARLFPTVAPGEALPKPASLPSLLPKRPPTSTAPAQWGMVIDTSVCIGCNACVVACQAENNIPAIGPEQIAKNRDMHWLRIDRYETGDADDPRPGFQPVPCMHCETAPCEPVCPVEASVHDSQGLNVQVYNRCIGTRTCQANCPYKVRHFNFLDYTGAKLWGDLDPAPVTAQRNPDVTVRARGVMEKCTYCVQRISAANREADATGQPLGPVVTACQAACPTRAIEFGDIADERSGVSRARLDPRHYGLLEELGTRPRTTYLARLVNDGEET